MRGDFDAKRYWEERLRDNWGLQGVGYIGYGPYYNLWMYRVRARVFSSNFPAIGIKEPSAIKALDIGSGTGFYIDLLRAMGVRHITGSDLTQVVVGKLAEKYPDLEMARLDIGGTLEGHGFDNRRFDLVTAFDILFHIVDNDAFSRAISNISALTGPGGHFIFSDNFLHGGRTLRSQHQVSRPLEETVGTLNRAGFEVIRRVPMFVIMNMPVDMPGTLPSFLWRAMMLPVRKFPPLGLLYGCLMYPVEMALLKLFEEGPSTEMMICRKAG